MLRKSKFQLLILIVLALALAQAAFAGLTAMGPSQPGATNGFPMWYTDANGVTVDLPTPIPTAGDGLTAPTMIYAAVIAG